MPARSIDGKAIAETRRGALTEQVHGLRARGIRPCLTAVSVSDDPAWAVYLKNQAAACAAVGVEHRIARLPAGAGQEDLTELIESLNVDPSVHGIILQSPLAAPLVDLPAQAQLSPDKDVEGVGPANLGLVMAGRPAAAPCTAVAAVALAQAALGDLRGIEAVVVGASTIVGRPAAQLLLAAGATVTTCHIDTRDLASHTRRAQLLVVAVGKAGLITAAHVLPGATVVDVGINRVAGADGRTEIVGDVHPSVAAVAAWLSPVPGGVGALTTTVLLEATVAAAERQAAGAPAIDGAALARILGSRGLDLAPDITDRLATVLASHLVRAPGARSARTALERRLGRGVLVVDGGVGTELIARGVDAARTADANVDHPDLVQAVHRAFLDAGAEAITANTFGANRYALRGDRERAVRLAAAGVRLAREVARGRAFVLGSIGPLGGVVGAEISVDDAQSAFAEVALAMADAGVEGFQVETMPSTVEAAAALAGVRRVSRLPVFVSRSLDRDDPAELAEFARACAGATALGINCAGGPRALAAVVARLATLTDLPVQARPNAGFPTREGATLRYHLRAEWLVAIAREYVAAGASIVGGCCGVAPAHIAALAKALVLHPLAARPGRAIPDAPAAPALVLHPLVVAARAGAFPIAALVPGRLGPASSSAALARLAAAGADTVGLLSGWPGGSRGLRLAAQLRHLQDATAKPAILELIPNELDLRAAHELLIAAHLLGIRLVLVDGGVFAGTSAATGGGDQRRGADTLDLLALIARLNAGRDLAGSRLESPTAFTVGVRVPERDAAAIEAYEREGAHFLALQPVYAPERFRALMATVRTRLPLFAEILLLPDAATADEIDNELPSLSVPDKLKRRLVADPDEDVRGVLRFLGHWRERLAGVLLLLPDARTHAAELLLTRARG